MISDTHSFTPPSDAFDDAPSSHASSASDSTATIEPPPRRYTVAIVDDEPATLDILRRSFRHFGFDVVCARDGRTALALAGQVDAMVLDVMMPGRFDGYGVASEMRVHHPRVPILMLSALAEPGDISRALFAGAHRFLTKPCSPVKVAREVARLLGMRTLPGWRTSMPRAADTERFDSSGQ